ncbi:hypothetical protein JCM10908_005446 [Rhodotorula pacifica]|uniref:thaumatin family protein n=1 Tax=Rhodotorula pacifica TaxID=1495444 RepID=UPI003179A45D
MQIMRPFSWAWLLTYVLLANAKTRKMTVANQCPYTVWPGLFTSVGPKPANTPTGWEAPSGTSYTFEVEESWGGRIWPRTDCDFSDSSKPGSLQCATGACNGGLECDPSTGTGVPPCSLAEFNIQSNIDHYDASNVDGFSIPIAISNSGGCPLANCPYDLLPTCPDSLKKKDASGKVVGCNTDCGANPDNAEYCCFGDHKTLDTCPASGIPNYNFWLKACPISYVYAYGDALALFTCTKGVDWTVTFCPGHDAYDTKVTFPDGKTTTQGEGFPKQTYVPITKTGVTAGGGGGGAKPTKTDAPKTDTAKSPTGSPTGATPSKTGDGASQPPETASPTASATGTSTGDSGAGAASGGASGAGSGAGTGAAATGGDTSGSGDSSSTDPSASSDSSSDTASGDTIGGVKSAYVYAVCGVVGFAILAVLGVFFMRQRHKRKHRDSHEAPVSDSEESASDSSDAGGHGHNHKRKKGSSDGDSSSSSSGDDRRSLGRFDALEKMERLAAQQSIYSAAAKNAGGLTGLVRSGQAANFHPRQRFELAKERPMSASSDSEDSSTMARSRLRGSIAYNSLI